MSAVENLIEVASRLKDAIVGLYEAYGVMPAIIEKEHRAIRAADFALIEGTRIEKEEAGDRIETLFAALMRAGEDLGRIRGQLLDTPKLRPVTLTECVEALDQITAALPSTDLGGQVLSHLVDGLKRLAKDFEARFREVKPIIEANRLLVTGMLHNIQESYRFWQEVSEQIAISYNAKGTQQAQGRNHGFKAKA